MTILLHSDTTTVVLNPQFESERNTAEISNANISWEGTDVYYKYSNFETFNLPIRYIPTSDALLINEWWENREQLTFKWENGSNYTVVINNGATPFSRLQISYWDLFTGSLILEEA